MALKKIAFLILALLILTVGQHAVLGSTYSSDINVNIQQTSGDCSSSTNPFTALTFNATVTTSGSGDNSYWVQMNASPGANDYDIDWLQYIMAVESNGAISGLYEYWNPDGEILEYQHTTQPIFTTDTHVLSGDSFTIEPTTTSGLVTGLTLQYSSPSYGGTYQTEFTTVDDVSILQWQTDVLGLNGYATFTSGGGSIVNGNSGGSLTYETGQANSGAGGCAPIQSAEVSNMEYSSPTTSDGEVYQNFGHSDVTVQAVDQNGNVLTGYYVSLYNSAGDQINSAYTPASFDGLSNGGSYSVEPNNYGTCNFNHWQDTGSGVADRSFTDSNSNPAILTAVYQCGNGGASTITIASDAENGTEIYGYATTLTGNGQDDSGYTPVQFSGLVSGDQYTVTVDNYGSCSFSNWSDGNTENPRSFTVSGQTVTAIYNCGGGESSPYVKVQSQNSDGGSISGYSVQLYYDPGGEAGSGYTTVTFSLTSGDGYEVYADSYGPCTFNHWENNDEGGGYVFTATGSTALTLTAVYDCS
jgi:hypothetical protein